MKKIKLILLLFLLAFIGLVGYENKGYFLTRQALDIDFYFALYQTPAIFNALYFIGCFVIGFLIAYFMSLATRFRSGKIIKELNTTLATHVEMIASLKNELDALKGTAAKSQPAAPAPEPVAEDAADTPVNA